MTDFTVRTFRRSMIKLLPERNWHVASTYDSLIITATGSKHRSGWGNQTLIGVIDGKAVEVITQQADDLGFTLESGITSLRMDCSACGGIHHIWKRGAKFVVCAALSSTEITVIRTAYA